MEQSSEKQDRRFIDDTTIHAVKDFYHAGKTGKWFWGVLGILAVMGLFFQLEAVVVQYLNEEVGATMSEFFPPHLPAVSICPDDWVNASKAERYNLTGKMVSVLNGFIPLRGVVMLYDFESSLNEEMTIQQVLRKAAMGYYAEYSQAVNLWNNHWGGNLDTMVSELALDKLTTMWHDAYPLDAGLKQSRIVTKGGVCYKFAGSFVVNAKQSNGAGIKLIIKQRLGMSPDILANSPTFKVVLTSVGEGNRSPHAYEKLKYGSHYVIEYSLTKVKRVSTRKWPCLPIQTDDEFSCSWKHGNEVAKGKTVVPYAIKGCESAIPGTDLHPATNTSRPCNTFVDLSGSSLFQYMRMNYTNLQWNNVCPRACVYTKYKYTTQVHQLRFTPGEEGDGDIRTMIEIKAASGMSSMEIQEYLTMPTSSMLSNVGGTLGLWMGASIMSIFQIIYLACLKPICGDHRGCCCCSKGTVTLK